MNRVVLLIVASLALHPSPSRGQGFPLTPEQPSSTGTASIHGRVVAADSNRPLRHARITASKSDERGLRYALTDGDGRFHFERLAKGEYSLSAARDGFVATSASQRDQALRPRQVTLADGQRADSVSFALPRASSVSGTVRDELGDPLPGIVVSALTYQLRGDQRSLTPAGSASSSITDDIGRFRISNLQPGAYYIMAAGAAERPGFSENSGPGVTPIFFPSAQRTADAQRISVGVGSRIANIDFVLPPIQTASISGRAVDAQNRPLASGFVNIRQLGVDATGRITVPTTGPDGSFTLSGLVPGEYELMIWGRAGPAFMGGVKRVTLTGEDVRGVIVAAPDTIVLKGRVTTDAPPDVPPPTGIGVVASPETNGVMWGCDDVHDDLTVDIHAIAATARLGVCGIRAPWSIKDILADGNDVTGTVLDLSARVPREIEVQLTNRRISVNGSVRDPRGNRIDDYTVIVFASEAAQRSVSARRFAIARPRADGGFEITSLGPGDFYAVAVDYMDGGDASDPKTLERLAAVATAFSLADGESKTLELRIQR